MNSQARKTAVNEQAIVASNRLTVSTRYGRRSSHSRAGGSETSFLLQKNKHNLEYCISAEIVQLTFLQVKSTIYLFQASFDFRHVL